MSNDLMNFLRVAKITVAPPPAQKFDFSLQLMLVMTVTVQGSPHGGGFLPPAPNLHKIIRFNFYQHHPATHQTHWAVTNTFKNKKKYTDSVNRLKMVHLLGKP